ncbi:MAG: dependent protein [Chloroflexia bacterium]|nr:dependent protein [Chloroflexia bacterium]
MSSEIADNVALVRERVARAAERAGHAADDVTLVAVTKTQPVDRILQAVEAGVIVFGENRVQEGIAKFAGRATGVEDVALVPRGGIELHMIGTLQRNKARHAARHFDCVHSVDNLQLARDLDAAVASERAGEPLPVLLEVNVTGEGSKSGVEVEELPRLAAEVESCGNLHCIGLMTIARFGAGEKELRETFAQLRLLLERMKQSYPGDWRHLSMGMSDDFEYAIEEGATLVRVGRAIFGERTRLG